jgi:hypothetical protein
MESYKVLNWVKNSEHGHSCDPSEPLTPCSRIEAAIDYCESIGYSKETKAQPEGVSYAEIQEIKNGKLTGSVWFFTK